MRKFVTAAILLCVAVVATANDEDLFPRPAELDRDVNFWLSIFTEYSTREGVLHDNRNLAVVYETVPLPENVSRRQRQRISDQRRAITTNRFCKRSQEANASRSARTNSGFSICGQTMSLTRNCRLRSAEFVSSLVCPTDSRKGLRRAGRYRDHVNREFTKLGVPVALAALPHVESSYNTEARSHVGASGIWQFTRGTGQRFMRVDHVLDERNDPFLATTAAGKTARIQLLDRR